VNCHKISTDVEHAKENFVSLAPGTRSRHKDALDVVGLGMSESPEDDVPDEKGQALLEEDDFQEHHLVIMWCRKGGVIGLDFDICDIRVVCLLCGNGTDCCVC